MNTNAKYLDTYQVLSTINRGSCSKIKAVRCSSTGLIYAAKIFSQNLPNSLIASESLALQNVTGPNIVQVFQVVFGGIYRKPNGSEFICNYILMELCSNGNLYSILSVPESLSPALIKNIFIQILSALESYHNSGFCHRDLKPENVLFDSNFTVKVGNSGSMLRIDSPSVRTMPGRLSAPESRRKDHRGDLADIFSLGVTLFVMHTQKYPFFSVDPCDAHYRSFVNKAEMFWDTHSQNKPEGFFDGDFKDLVGRMMSMNPELRPTIEEIRRHPWVAGAQGGANELFEEIRLRRVRAVEADMRTEESKRSGHRLVGFKGEASSGDLSLSLDDLKVKPYKGDYCFDFTKIVSFMHPKEMFAKVYEYFTKIDVECKIGTEYYELKTSVITEQDNLELKINVYQEDLHYVFVVKMIRGNNLDLIDIIRNIRAVIEVA